MEDIQNSLKNSTQIDDLGQLKNGDVYIDKKFNREKIMPMLKNLQSLLAPTNSELTVVIMNEGSESNNDAIVKPSNISIEDVKHMMINGKEIDGHVYEKYKKSLNSFISDNNLQKNETYTNNDLVSVNFTKKEPINQETKKSFKEKILDDNGYRQLSPSEKLEYVEHVSDVYHVPYHIHNSINNKEDEINKYIEDKSYNNELTMDGGKRKTSRNQKKSRKARKSRRKSNRRRGRR